MKKVEINFEIGLEDFEFLKDIDQEQREILLALRYQDLSDTDAAALFWKGNVNMISKINYMDADNLRAIYAGNLLHAACTDKQREVLSMMLDKKNPQEIADKFGVSRRAIRERMILIQRKGAKIKSKADEITDRETLRILAIKSHPTLKILFESVKKQAEADGTAEKCRQLLNEQAQ